MCAVPTLVTTPQSGAAMRASAAISPAWFMPISTTAYLVLRLQAQQFAAADRMRCSDCLCDLSTLNFAPSAAAMASLVVVLPAEPVIGHHAPAPLAAHVRGQRLQGASGSSAISSGAARAASGREATRARETTAATAPRSSAAATKSCPSSRSPRTAKNSSPGATVRESME